MSDLPERGPPRQGTDAAPPEARRVDVRGIAWFLGITFVITWGTELALIAGGMRLTGGIAEPRYVGFIAGLMFVPALAAWITVRWVTREGTDSLLLRFGPIAPYIRTGLIIPTVFLAAYLLTWAVGLGAPDWHLEWLQETARQSGQPMGEIPPPGVVIPLLYLSILLFTPFVNTIPALGEEIGWRGFLLPRLLPLGRWKAHLIVGTVWTLWHAPLVAVGFGYPGHPVLGLLCFFLLLIGLSFFMGELTLRHRSSVLAGWMHGVFNSQAYGALFILFPEVDPLLGGKTGLIHGLLWVVAGVIMLRRGERSSS